MQRYQCRDGSELKEVDTSRPIPAKVLVVGHAVPSSCTSGGGKRRSEDEFIRRHIQAGLQPSLAASLGSEASRISTRIYLLDNSGSTSIGDGHMVVPTGLRGQYSSIPCTRWDEIKNMALNQARWNASLGVRAEFILLNPPCPQDPMPGRDFMIIDSDGTVPNPVDAGVEEQVAALQRMLDRNGPRGPTPLVARLQELQRRLKLQFVDGERIMLTIATDGVPTCPGGNSSSQDQVQLVQVLRGFVASFNALIVIRLATDDEKVVEFYNKVDEDIEFALDILDDLEGEAKEIAAAGNDWFAYTPMMHCIREAGTAEKPLDTLDERALTVGEIATMLEFLFRGEDHPPFPRDPAALLQIATQVVKRSPPVFDGRRGKMAAPIDTSKLRRALYKHRTPKIGWGIVEGSTACTLM